MRRASHPFTMSSTKGSGMNGVSAIIAVLFKMIPSVAGRDGGASEPWALGDTEAA
jgi:hypothetical protein